MGWKQLVKDYLSFTRRDRIAIIVLLLLIGMVFFLPEFMSRAGNSAPGQADTAWLAALKRIEQADSAADRGYPEYGGDNSTAYQYDRPQGNYSKKSKGQLFDFDPNSLSTAGWQKLGLRDKTIATIQNYLSKGGKFRKPEDLQRVYGLFPDEFERIAPYIRIESKPETNIYKNFEVKDPVSTPSSKTFSGRYSIIDINTADTTEWIALPGIGNKLAARIVNFRDKLGGFYSINQVGETFGLPDSTFQKIKKYLELKNRDVRKININTASLEELKAHPYIRYALANPIVAYRQQHGPFIRIEDLKKVMVITDVIFDKIASYFTVE